MDSIHDKRAAENAAAKLRQARQTGEPASLDPSQARLARMGIRSQLGWMEVSAIGLEGTVEGLAARKQISDLSAARDTLAVVRTTGEFIISVAE